MIHLILLLSLFTTNLESRAEKHLTKYYQHEITLSEGQSFYDGTMYQMLNNTDFVYIGKSRSKFDHFDYMVLFDENKSIKLVRVLIYRENYGGEVGSRRWLKQWIGISKPKHMVDAISGATISVNSLKQSINTLLTKV
jgi:uncharacterized protein with FMN-binding domain